MFGKLACQADGTQLLREETESGELLNFVVANMSKSSMPFEELTLRKSEIVMKKAIGNQRCSVCSKFGTTGKDDKLGNLLLRL